MADIVLAEHQGQAWLVSGEAYIDDLLANTLPPDVSIEIVSCESQLDVMILCENQPKLPNSSATPWVVHPGIVARIRRRLIDMRVLFTPWSAMLDDRAKAVISEAAARATVDNQTDVTLVRQPISGEPREATDLANLRINLIAAMLVNLGVQADRIARDARASEPAGGDWIDIIVPSA